MHIILPSGVTCKRTRHDQRTPSSVQRRAQQERLSETFDDGPAQMRTWQLLRDVHHPDCIVCGTASAQSLGLRCHLSDGPAVTATFHCREVFQGYPSVMHGGVISSLLDGAMTNCMFAHGWIAVTAELRIRFRHPVATGHTATVRAWIEKSSPPLYVLKAELTQNDEVKAQAQGKFCVVNAICEFSSPKRPPSPFGRQVTGGPPT